MPRHATADGPRCKTWTLPLMLALVALSACGGGSDGGKPVDGETGSEGPVLGGGSSLKLSPICDSLDGFIDNSESPAPLTVRGYSFVLFDRDQTLLNCSGGNQTATTAVPIASASKLASAAAIMTLVDESWLDLDMPVAQYLAGSGVNWPADKAAITTRMLLSHTSGLPGLADATNPGCSYQDIQLSLAACVQQIADTPLVSAPGTVFNYGAASYQVAGYIATQIAGQSWQDFFSSRIAGPLGMSTFSYGGATTINPGIAGGASSNAADYAKLLKLFLVNGDEDVLTAPAVQLMETNQIDGLPMAYSPLDAALYPEYTLGFFASAPAVHPDSAGPELSDPGLYGTVPWIDLGAGYGAVLLIRSDSATGLAMWTALRPQIISALQR